MENRLILFHGSDKVIERPVFGAGKAHNDFGLGFYCTESESLAKEWACSSLRDGFANRYTLDLTDLRVLYLNSSDYSILNWIAILVSHRLFRIKTPIAGKAMHYLQDNFNVNVNAYDAIVGYRADDSYFDFADAFLNNGITVEQLARAMRLGNLGEQFVLKSKLAFERIRFDGFSVAERESYYPIRKQRNDDAVNAYLKLSAEEADGLYMADIMRGGITNNDTRIPRNIS